MAKLRHDEISDELREWLNRWAECVRTCDFASARALFSPEVVGFGTRMHVVRGLDRLEQLQWRHVWPTIDGFQFVLDELHASVSDDLTQAWGVVPWISTGFHEDGTPFDRPGRATIVFAQEGDPTVTPGGWLAAHTHISLGPGTPPRSFGRPDEL